MWQTIILVTVGRRVPHKEVICIYFGISAVEITFFLQAELKQSSVLSGIADDFFDI